MYFELSLIGIGVTGLALYRFLRSRVASQRERDMVMLENNAKLHYIIETLTAKAPTTSRDTHPVPDISIKDRVFAYLWRKCTLAPQKYITRLTLLRSSIIKESPAKNYGIILEELQKEGLVILDNSKKLENCKIVLTNKGENKRIIV